VPLIILTVLGVIAIGGGYYIHKRIQATVPAPTNPAPITGRPFVPTSSAALPAICQPKVQQPAHQFWLDGEAAKAQAVFDAHADDLKQPYVVGKDGWTFWNDVQAQNFSQAVGKRVLSNQEATQWHTYLKRLQDSLAAKHIPLYVAITPAKWDVYPQDLPDWAQKIRGSGPLDQLLHQYPDLPIIDMREPLRDASKLHPVYSKVNSHWTDYGASIGWTAMSQCINAATPALGPLSTPLSGGVTLAPDINEFASYGITNATPDWTVPAYSEPLKPVTVTSEDGISKVVKGTTPTDESLLPLRTTTPGAQSKHSALVLRDSMGNGLSVFLQQSFHTTWQARHNFDDPSHIPDIPALVTKHKPDVVILQIAERFLNFPPPATSTASTN
jgi:hypothetical protein